MHLSPMKPFLGAVALCLLMSTGVFAAPISGQADVVDGDTCPFVASPLGSVSMASILLKDSSPVRTLPANGISVAPGRRMLSQP